MSGDLYESDLSVTRRGGFGEIFLDTGDPVDVQNDLQQWVTGVERLNENVRGLVERADREAAERRRRTGQPPVSPAPLPPARTVTRPAPNAAPVGGDSPAAQGAPDVAVPAEKEIQLAANPPTSPPLVSAREPSHNYYDQDHPVEPEEIVRLLAAPPADFDDFVTRLQRNQPLRGERHPSHAAPATLSPAQDGDPVDLFTGAFTLRAVDLAVPTAHIPIEMSRSYRSGRAYFGPFGFGWDHSYNVYLRALADGGMALWGGQLREQHFTLAAGGFAAAPGLAAVLEQAASAGEVFTIHLPDGDEWLFERPSAWSDPERIPLVRIRDRHGNAVHLTYGPTHQVEKVLDDRGRGLLFHYGTCDLLERVTDHVGARAVLYEHDPEIEHLVCVTLPATSQYPDGIATHYEYASYDAHPAMRHNIVRVLDADRRRMVENDYAGPGAGWEFNSVVRQRVAGFEYQFGYEQIQYVAADPAHVDVLATRTLVRPPDGSLHTYTFNYRGDLLDHRFRLVRDGSLRVVSRQWEHDSEGNVVATVAPDGIRRVFTFDSSNADPRARRNLLRIEQAAALPGIVPSRTLFRAQYEPRYQLPITALDETGAVTRYVYDLNLTPVGSSGRVARIEHPDVVLPDGTTQKSIVTYDIDAFGRLTAVTSPENHRTNVHYVAGGLLDGFIESIENVLVPGPSLLTTFTYDAAGFVAAVHAPGGGVTQLFANALGQIERTELPAINGETGVVRRWFDDSGGIVRLERPAGSSAPAFTSGTTLVDELVRDEMGIERVATFAANTSAPRQRRQLRDHEGRIVGEWDSRGVRTDRVFGEDGELLSETVAAGDAAAETTSYGYDPPGRLARKVAPDGDITTFNYDVWGRPQRVHLPTGGDQVYKWGPGDRLLEERMEERALGGGAARVLRKQTYEYDQRGRLASTAIWSFRDLVSTAVPLSARFRYDRDDRKVEVQLPRGGVERFGFDALNRITRTVDAHGTTHDLVYGPSGDLASITRTRAESGGLRSRIRTFTYDARRRLVRSDSEGSFSTLAYDDRDLPIAERTKSGSEHATLFDPHGQVFDSVIDPGGLALHSRFEHDANGQLVRFIDPTGAATSWAYDPLGRLTQLTLPDGATWQHSIDVKARTAQERSPAGNLVVVHRPLDPLQPTTLTTFAAPGHAAVLPLAFRFDPLGRIVSASNGAATVGREYDGLGRILRETARGQAVVREYDDLLGFEDLVFPDGRRERTTLSATGSPERVTLVSPGALGGTAGEVLLEIAYASDGRPRGLHYGNGVEAEVVYDAFDRLLRLEYTQAGVMIDSCRVRYDDSGHAIVNQYLGAPARNIVHSFDRAGRLVEVRSGFPLPALSDNGAPPAQAADVAAALAAAAAAPGLRFTVNAADAQTAATGVNGGGPDATYSLLADHRIAATTATTFTHTADGTRTLDDRYRYDLDGWGRVTRVRDRTSGTVLAEMQYDALGRPAEGAIDGQPFERWYDDQTLVHEVIGLAGGTQQRSHHPLWPGPFRVVDASGPAFIHQDTGWSTLCVTGATGDVLERHRFGTFGTPVVLAPDGVTPLTRPRVEPHWRGMPAIGTTTLFATAARLFDAATGVFTSPDPLLYVDSPSVYSFAAHNPVDFADPTGFAKQSIAKTEPPTGLEKWLASDSKNVLRSKPHPGDLWKELNGVDTGSTPLNYGVNAIISLSNIAKGLQNVPFEMLYDLDDALRHSRFKVEYEGPFQFMAPLMKGMGLGASTAGTITYLRGVMPKTAALLKSVAKSLALSIVMAGEFGGGLIPARVVRIGKTPVFADSKWARYQRWATGTRFETIFRLFIGKKSRDLLADGVRRGFFVEAKLGNMGQMWNPDREAQVIEQARTYLMIDSALGTRGVRYAVSTELGAMRLRWRFNREFPAAVKSGQLSVWWVPGPP